MKTHWAQKMGVPTQKSNEDGTATKKIEKTSWRRKDPLGQKMGVPTEKMALPQKKMMMRKKKKKMALPHRYRRDGG
eukprot:4388290-Amphidinium_carterae.2